jgi:3-methyladenine DNA glycosylase AlkD
VSEALHVYWQPLKAAFERAADPVVAKGASAYMKHISIFFGIKAPDRRQLLQTFLETAGLPKNEDLQSIIRNAWNQPQREFHYVAMELAYKLRKKSGNEAIELYEWMITNKSWWDTVDFIAPNLVGEHFKHFPDSKQTHIRKWMESGSIWLQRTCLLFQLKYKAATDEELLFSLCASLAAEKEFFIRKAIGWALRAHARINPDAVRQFAGNTPLSGLSRREALKHL